MDAINEFLVALYEMVGPHISAATILIALLLIFIPMSFKRTRKLGAVIMAVLFVFSALVLLGAMQSINKS